MNKLKISFCITYYNQQDFVEKSINSILDIDIPCDFEILVGDDGSTDNTQEQIKAFHQLYPDKIKYFIMQRNETSKSINRASLNRLNLAKRATGDYILFLDGDDYYCSKSFINNALNIFNKYNNIEVCMFNFKYLHTNNTEEVFSQKIKQGFVNCKKYISKGFYSHSGACVFKNIFDKEKIENLYTINNFDDNAITIYMLQFGGLYYIDEPIYIYRQTENSLWNNSDLAEQHLLNAFDYKLITSSAPKFKKYIAKRQYGAMKYIFKNRKKLQIKLGKKYEKYLNMAEYHNDIFIKNVLIWNELDIINKVKTQIQWIFYKINVNH